MIGRRLSHYEVTAKIGAGGMGEVYRARDTRLDRDVAIKILPQTFASDGDRLARFEREAKVLASLNHSNIAAIHGIEEAGGIRFLVLELVEGEDLSERIARGAIPVNESMVIARQIAEALEDAHNQGVIHRDLKPANIKITPDGRVKLLDFGLAKAMSPDADSSARELSQSPTIMSDATQQGVILGTAAYMSPEQARGKPADHRTDIWAFGCVAFEMLTGHACYEGETVTDVLTGILHREPDLTQLPTVPAGLRRAIERCLRKDLHRRTQHIGDVRIEIDDALAGNEGADEATATKPPKRRWAGLVGGGIAGIIVGAALIGLFGGRGGGQDTTPRVRFTVDAPEGVSTLENPLLSPDGRWLVCFTSSGVLLHDLERDESRLLPALAEASRLMCFSPDSEWLAFNAVGRLQKVRISGGVPVDLVDVGTQPGVAWGSRGTIVYPTSWTSPLYEIPEDGGEARQITTLDTEAGETGHWSPQFLPDGRHLLFTAFTTRGSLKHGQMYLLDLDTGERTSLGVGAYPVYLTSGDIVYHRSGLYEMAPFDLGRKELTGPPRVVMEDVPHINPYGNGDRYFSVSDNGVLAEIAISENPSAGTRSFYRVDRDGDMERLPIPANQFRDFALSPDGKRIVCSVYEAGEYDLYVYDVDQGTGRKVTRESNNIMPHWHPDGHRVAFNSTRRGTFDAYVMNVDASDPPQPVLSDPRDDWPYGWSADGALLVGITTEDRSDDVVAVTDGGTTDLLATAAAEGEVAISPDGRWIAYRSDRSGRYEVYVQTLGGSSSFVQVSTDGGAGPIWSGTGDELYFREGPMMGDIKIVRTALHEGRFVAGHPEPFLRGGGAGAAAPIVASADGNQYEASPDGRLIVLVYDTSPVPRVHISLDGFAELERQATAER